MLALFIAGSLFYKYGLLQKINSSVRKSFALFFVLIAIGISLNIFTDSIAEGLSGFMLKNRNELFNWTTFYIFAE
jgi:hypothetical protein